MFSKYRELGLALIPLDKGKKFRKKEGWSDWCERLPTEAETELWDTLWENGHRSVGLCLGPASGVMALDLDSDDPELLALAPPSPVRKFGAKGETRFFRPTPDLTIRHYNGLDVLWTGAQTVLPPSPHPDTGKPYIWLTPDTLENFSVKDLPIVNLDFIPSYTALFEKKYPLLCKYSIEGHATGRNNWLMGVVWAKRKAGETEEEIVEAIYQMDIAKNNPRLFSDAKEGNPAKDENDARNNAWKFVLSVSKTFAQRGAGPAPSVVSLELALLDKKEKKFEPLPYPIPTGILGSIYKTCIKMSTREQRGLSIGGAIAIGSVILANRFKFRGLWPNVAILNIAPTGAGKSFPQNLAKSLLAREAGNEDLYGFGNYQSSVAITKNLDRKRERLDVVDEATTLFSTISDGGVFQKSIDDLLCQLYSNSQTLFVGGESAGKEAIRVWHPCISLLMSTTPDGLKTSISRSIATKGFFPRCLPFIDGYGPQKKIEPTDEDIKILGAFIRDFRTRTVRPMTGKGTDLVNPVPNPIEIECAPEVTAALDDQVTQWNDQVTEPGRSEIDRGALSRAGEQAIKLALIHGALRTEKVEMEDLLWAIQMVDTVRVNSTLLFPQLGAENKTQGNLERVYALILEEGILRHQTLIDKTRYLMKRERNDILESLVEAEKIQKIQTDRGATWSIR